MTHIALLLPNLGVGGAERVLLFLAQEFVALGHEVDLVTLSALGPLADAVPKCVHLVDLGMQRRVPRRLIFAPMSIWRLARWMRGQQPDVLLSSVTGANLVALLARKVARSPFRLAIRVSGSVRGLRRGFRIWAMQWLYPQADVVIALSSVMAEDLTNVIGVPTSRIQVIPNPVDIADVCEQSQASLPHPWLEDQRLRVVLSVGRLVPEKDFPVLLRAFAKLSHDPSLRLIIVGEGPERSKLESLIAHLAIAARVELVGFDSNPWRWMARSDLFVLCSRSEGMPNVIIESRVLGVPIVMTEYDMSAREVGGDEAILVPVQDVDALANGIVKGLSELRRTPTNSARVVDLIARYLEVING